MRIESNKHENVLPDGRFKDQLGAVTTSGRIAMSGSEGGCGVGRCTCSDGHWINITEARTKDGIVKSVTVYFDDKDEMQRFFDQGTLHCNN